MSPALWAAFAAATAVLMLIPGPNVALTVAALGVTAVFGALAEAFGTLRWLGVAYLVWLGIRAWREPASDLSETRAAPPSKTFGRGFFVSLTNPKTLAFYAAFLPQFLDPAKPLGPQMAILSVTFVAVALIIDSGWALLAARARGGVARFGRLRNRLTGAALIGAALGLALARR
jgi:threonine/homoserine/homoserine lactone efflux protein